MIEAVRPRTGIAESPRPEVGRMSERIPRAAIITPATTNPITSNGDGLKLDGEYSRTLDGAITVAGAVELFSTSGGTPVDEPTALAAVEASATIGGAAAVVVGTWDSVVLAESVAGADAAAGTG